LVLDAWDGGILPPGEGTVEPEGRADLARAAREVLDRNRRGDWTCPAAELYPHQWLWDSCFIAVGLATYDPPRAAGELRALFRGQWANGMLPHVIFSADVPDVGSRRLWRSARHPLAPRGVDTSCITQPPVVAPAVWRVGHALPAPERAALFAELLPRLVDYHAWLYRERDLRGSGLVTLIHPWECGLDTTPPWMDSLARAPMPPWVRVATALHVAHVMRFVRRDTKLVPPAERPTDDEGLRMLALARLAERHGFELRRMPLARAVLLEDLAFNAMLAAANEDLARIADAIGRTLPPEVVAGAARTRAAFDGLWDDRAGQYFSRDATSGRLVVVPTVATFLPLWAGIPARERSARLVALLREPGGFRPAYPVPTVPTDSAEYQEQAYWKGPTWVNTNWMVVDALERNGEAALARDLRERTLNLVARGGFAEYFSALHGDGYGAPRFSWTAALVLDLLAR
jgi:hypothetical protein